jgi:hypothetical protein
MEKERNVLMEQLYNASRNTIQNKTQGFKGFLCENASFHVQIRKVCRVLRRKQFSQKEFGNQYTGLCMRYL